MRITTLMEDTAGAAGLPCEHGLSFYIETPERRLLIDTGASALTWENAAALGIDPSRVDTVVLSHGHYDHTGGLLSLLERAPGARVYMRRAACGCFFNGDRYIGIDPRVAELPEERLTLVDREDAYPIDDGLCLFAGVRGRRLWPASNRTLTSLRGGARVQDDFSHEQCAVLTETGTGRRILLSGCAHNGILNILDRFDALFGGVPDAVVSGFHMMKKTDYTQAETDDVLATARALSALPTVFFTGHCTGDAAFALMKPVMGDRLVRLRAGDVIDV